jgi:type VII secretion-associated serine protease mycosin
VHPVRGTVMSVALGAALLLMAATAPAISAATTPTPDGATTATADPAAGTATPTAPLPVAAAQTEARQSYEESAPTEGAAVPLVTVETSPGGAPTITSHPVTSSAQAEAVATEAAKGNDLVSVQPDTVVRPTGNYTSDTYSRIQWALNPWKTTFTKAWRIRTGAGIVVAVIDTGVDAGHPDLAGQVLPGHQFLNGSTYGAPMSPATDSCGHGTHVAGTIAALANNRVGVAGVAPGVKILPVKVLNCSGYSSDVANGITWATKHGARVINLSLGGPSRDSSLEAAINYARSRKVVVVAAAGNNHGPRTTCGRPGTNARSYPAASPGVIAVGAVDERLSRACFSNTGTYVDVVAPGYNVVSTYPLALAQGSVPYRYMSGTSMAAPHVAAAAAIVLSRWPTCTADRVERKIESTTRRLGRGALRNNAYGYGLVDPARAVTAPAC